MKQKALRGKYNTKKNLKMIKTSALMKDFLYIHWSKKNKKKRIIQTCVCDWSIELSAHTSWFEQKKRKEICKKSKNK